MPPARWEEDRETPSRTRIVSFRLDGVPGEEIKSRGKSTQFGESPQAQNLSDRFGRYFQFRFPDRRAKKQKPSKEPLVSCAFCSGSPERQPEREEGARMGPLKEKLQRLQCHFTWDFEVKDKIHIRHILITLALRLEHGPLCNRGTYLALKAYLHHLEGSPKEALAILQEAKEVLRKEPQGTFSRQALLVYGNYAWIYYHLTDYDKVDLYLAQIRQICRDLSSPEPYSAPIPEVYAQKGWSLLAMGFRNGHLAKECFQKALELQESSVELQEGLAFSAFASWTHCYDEKLEEESQKLLEGLICSHPENYEAKVYLAQILCRKDNERAWHLANNVVQNSRNPELLRIAAKVYKFHFLSKAISTLKKAISLCGDYYLLYYDLGICYMDLLDRRFEGDRAEIVEEAIGCIKRALEANPESMFSQLKLAKLYGERCLLYEEEVYLGMMEALPTTSKRCQQSFYIHWGDFLVRKKGQKQAALRAYEACLAVPGDHPLERKQLGQRLKELARVFHFEGETEQERVVRRLLHEMEAKHQGGPSAGLASASRNHP